MKLLARAALSNISPTLLADTKGSDNKSWDNTYYALGHTPLTSDDALRRSMLPSGWSCLALIQHLALDVERFWFRAVVAGEQIAIDQLADIGNAWEIDPAVSSEAIFDLYRQEIGLANSIIATTPLESVPVWWPEGLFGDWRIQDVRQVILHVMTETAVHAGHLDAVRELIDGRKWLVLTD